jgi:hypothetical protein
MRFFVCVVLFAACASAQKPAAQISSAPAPSEGVRPTPELQAALTGGPCMPKCLPAEYCSAANGKCFADPCMGNCLKSQHCVDSNDPPSCEILPLWYKGSYKRIP